MHASEVIAGTLHGIQVQRTILNKEVFVLACQRAEPATTAGGPVLACPMQHITREGEVQTQVNEACLAEKLGATGAQPSTRMSSGSARFRIMA